MERNIASSPKCSRDEPIPNDIQLCQELQELHDARQIANTVSETSQEIATHTLDTVQSSQSSGRSRSINITVPTGTNVLKEETSATKPVTATEYAVPLLLISGHPSILIRTSQATRTCALTIQSPITSQPLSSLHPQRSFPPETQPRSLFLQALTKLTENSSMNVTVLNNLIMKSQYQSIQNATEKAKTSDLSPPDSLNSAPPSYSYVLRQMAIRRRPRLMGTFIPSPSFIPHVPPPNYNAPFDIYVDTTMAPPPTRVRRFGFTSMPTVCPECGYTGMSVTTSKITLCTHLSAIILCLLCCWACAPLPYLLRSCKDVYHHCRNCRNFLGMYCPTSAENGIH